MKHKGAGLILAPDCAILPRENNEARQEHKISTGTQAEWEK